MLSEELLSFQIHYDWRLRAMKSLLRMAGKLLRLAGPGVTEYTVLKSALKNFNLPRVITNDKPIFEMLCEDLFSKLPVNSESDNNYMEKTRSLRPRIHQEIPTRLPRQKRLLETGRAGHRTP